MKNYSLTSLLSLTMVCVLCNVKSEEIIMSQAIKNKFTGAAGWKKATLPLVFAAAATIGLTGCEDAATKVSRNLSTAADNFEIQREIVFYNGITGDFFATVVGRCSIEVDAPKDKLDVTCKHGPDDYRKHFLGRSDNVTFFVLQTEGANVSEYNTRVTFNPQGFIPDVDFRGDAKELLSPTRPDTHGQEVPQQTQPVTRSEQPATGGRLPIQPR